MSTLGVIPIRPSPQKLSAACVVLTTTPVQVTAAGALKPQPQPPRRPQLARDQRRRVGYQSYVPPPQPTNVLRRNARERNRVKQVNHGFAALRNHIPSAAKNKKLSKVDTLRRAVEYIQNLQALIDESDAAGSPHTSPPLQTLTPASTCSGDSGFAETRPLYLGSPAPAGHSPAPVGHSPAPVGHSPALLPATAHLSPPCSDASSPAPSFASDQPSYGPQPDYDATGYADYADHGSGYGETENLSPADEELLDAIAWWQSSQ